MIFVIFIFNLFRFAAVIFLISTQYVHHGIEQFPNRLNYCVNDLSIYKLENSEVSFAFYSLFIFIFNIFLII